MAIVHVGDHTYLIVLSLFVFFHCPRVKAYNMARMKAPAHKKTTRKQANSPQKARGATRTACEPRTFVITDGLTTPVPLSQLSSLVRRRRQSDRRTRRPGDRRRPLTRSYLDALRSVWTPSAGPQGADVAPELRPRCLNK